MKRLTATQREVLRQQTAENFKVIADRAARVRAAVKADQDRSVVREWLRDVVLVATLNGTQQLDVRYDLRLVTYYQFKQFLLGGAQ